MRRRQISAATRKGQVLIVDDDDELRTVVSEVLRAAGYEVAAAQHGGHALSLLERMHEPPSMMLLDLAMPVMTGWELLAALRADARWRAIPVVIVSGEEPTLLQHRPSFSRYLKKPVTPSELLTAVRDYFKK